APKTHSEPTSSHRRLRLGVMLPSASPVQPAGGERALHPRMGQQGDDHQPADREQREAVGAPDEGAVPAHGEKLLHGRWDSPTGEAAEAAPERPFVLIWASTCRQI